MRSYFTVVGIVLAVLIGAGLWLKPSPQEMRDIVDREVARYSQARSEVGETVPAITSVDADDWVVAVSHVVRMGEHTFYCAGAYRVTVCGSPD